MKNTKNIAKRTRNPKPQPAPVQNATPAPAFKVGDMVMLLPDPVLKNICSHQVGALGKIAMVDEDGFGARVTPENPVLCDVNGTGQIYWQTKYLNLMEQVSLPPAPTSDVLDAVLPHLYECLEKCEGNEGTLTSALFQSYSRVSERMGPEIPLASLVAFQAAVTVYIKKIGYPTK